MSVLHWLLPSLLAWMGGTPARPESQATIGASAGPSAVSIEASENPKAASIEAPGEPTGSPLEEGWLTVSRGEGFDPLLIPRSERLDYDVIIDTFLGDIDVGTVSLNSGTEPYNPGLPLGTSPAPGNAGPKSGGASSKTGSADAGPKPEVEAASKSAESPKDASRLVGTIQSVAHGSYLGYTLHHELDVRHLPQLWPSAIYRDRQSGTENRQRELKFGVLDGKPTSEYRSDGHCNGCSNPEHFVESAWIWGKPYHCEKCKRAEHRVWDPSTKRAIPTGTVDLLSAVYLARELVRQGGTAITFPVLDKRKLWTLTVRRGETSEVEVMAGKFRCSLVTLKTSAPPGEPVDKDGFTGLFGIRGGIQIFMEAATGVPVQISGQLPVPVIGKLDLHVKLKGYRGTPAGFAPIR